MLPYITLFGNEIPLYGLFWFGGILLACFVGYLILSKRSLPPFDFFAGACYAMIGAIIGAKLLFIIVSWKQITALNLSLLSVLKGGFVFYGGLIGGAAGLIIYAKQFKLPVSDFFDIGATVLPLGHALGRVGCYFSGCCYGMEYDGPLAVTYSYSYGLTPINTPLFPIQLLESALLFILFAVLIILFLKHSQKRYLNLSVYITAYSVMRFVLEFFRGDKERGSVLSLSTSQIISLALLVIMLTIFYLNHRIVKAYKEYTEEHPSR